MMPERAPELVAEPVPAALPTETVPPPDGPRLTAATSLSPSRASDFMTCPLRYRFRVIDRLPEVPSLAAVRGSVVHKVLEELFDLPARDRTHARASLMIGPVWEALLAEEPELAEMWPGGVGSSPPSGQPTASPSSGSPAPDLATWLAECRDLLERYFELEDPQRLEPAEREVHVVTTLESGLTIHGYIDRLDLAPTGEMRIVDYKTGASPSEFFEAKALFQMKFYALVMWRTRGDHPRPCCSSSTSATPRCCVTGRTRPTCWLPSARSRPCGRPSGARPRPASGSRTSPSCAAGAATRRSARHGAGSHRHCRSPRSLLPWSPSTPLRSGGGPGAVPPQ